jgi:hypothetical protein
MTLYNKQYSKISSIKVGSSINVNTIILYSLLIIWISINTSDSRHNLFIDGKVLIYANILCLEILMISLLAKRYSNIYLTVLSFMMTYFFALRVLTIMLFPPNRFLIQSGIYAYDYQKSLLVVIIIIPFLWLVSFVCDKYMNSPKVMSNYTRKHHKIKGVVFIYALSNILLILTKILSSGFLQTVLTYASQIISLNLTFFFLMIYYFLNVSLLNKKEKIIIAIMVIMYMITDVMLGNKSSVFKIIQMTLMANLIVKRIILIKYKTIILLTVSLILSIQLYFVGNIIRDEIWSGDRNIKSIVEVALTINTEYYYRYGLYAASHLSGRIGYLDFTTAIIKRANEYSKVFTPMYYFKSIVDYTVPIIDVFDIVRVSNVITFTDKYGYIPIRKDYIDTKYHSNCITIFAEMYAIGDGILGAIILLLIYYYVMFSIFNHYAITSKTLFQHYAIRGMQLSFFMNSIISFGIDWYISSMVFAVIYYIMFSKYYTKKGLNALLG